jgi:hypothetical protein
MANLHSDGSLIRSSMLLQEYGLIVADRAALPNHPAIAGGYLGLGNESSTVTRTLADLGTGVAGTISENGAVVPSDLVFSTVSATVVRKSKGRSRSDFLKFYDQTGILKDPAALAMDAAMIRANTLMGMVAESVSAATTDVTPGSGAALTWAKLSEAKQTLVQTGQDFADGELMAILHPKQWGNLETAAIGTGLGDALTHSAEAYNIQYARAIGYQGRFFGIDIFTSTRVPTANAGADSRGALFAPGGVVWAEGIIEPDPDGFMDILDGGRLQIEYERDASRMQKAMYYNFLVGTSLGEDARVVTITNDR